MRQNIRIFDGRSCAGLMLALALGLPFQRGHDAVPQHAPTTTKEGRERGMRGANSILPKRQGCQPLMGWKEWDEVAVAPLPPICGMLLVECSSQLLALRSLVEQPGASTGLCSHSLSIRLLEWQKETLR